MRILKYLLLLFFLFLIGLTVFVTTQKGEFDIVRTKIIAKPKATIYNYIVDYRNWETFGTWVKDNANFQSNYPNYTPDNEAFVTWKNNDDRGYARTLAIHGNDSISQKIVWNQMNSKLNWTLKDTLGKTKITLRIKGKIDLKTKIYTFLNGGINSIVGDFLDKNLIALDRTLNFELNSYKVKINGIVSIPQKYYIGQSINCYEDKVMKNVKIMIPNLLHFFNKNKMTAIGKPFVLYNNQNSLTNTANITVSMAVRDSIFITEGSDMTSGKLNNMSALKVTLLGDYSHLKAARKKAEDYINRNQIKVDASSKTFEIYRKTIQDVKNPSQWLTEIYIPIIPKHEVTPINTPVLDSIH